MRWLVAALFLCFGQPAFAELPFKVGDVRDVTGGICFEEGHIEVAEALVEDFLEGSQNDGSFRVAEEWQRQVANGQCRWFPVLVSLKVADIEGPFDTIYGPSYSIKYEGSPPLYAIILYKKKAVKRGVAI